MPCTQAHLKRAAKWRDANRDKANESCRISHKKYYNSEKENNRVMKYYYFKKECQRLRDILLD